MEKAYDHVMPYNTWTLDLKLGLFTSCHRGPQLRQNIRDHTHHSILRMKSQRAILQHVGEVHPDCEAHRPSKHADCNTLSPAIRFENFTNNSHYLIDKSTKRTGVTNKRKINLTSTFDNVEVSFCRWKCSDPGNVERKFTKWFMKYTPPQKKLFPNS